jgi:hypothetical protein
MTLTRMILDAVLDHQTMRPSVAMRAQSYQDDGQTLGREGCLSAPRRGP